MDTEATADDGPTRPIGETLAAARRARGLELTDIARDTRVPVRHLAAIEADDHDGLPALPYAIGFVKAFARAVDIDPNVAAARFRGETSKGAHVPQPPTMIPVDERRLPPRGLVAASLAALLVVVGGIVAWSAGVFDGAPPAVVAAAGPRAAVPPPTPATPAAAALPPVAAGPVVPAATLPAAAVAGATAPPPQATGNIVITASEDAWFKVSVYDPAARKVVTVKTGVLAKGERYVPPPTPGLRLWTGRAGALRITVDGRALPPLGGPVETVKNVSLDVADLRARLAPAGSGGVPPAR